MKYEVVTADSEVFHKGQWSLDYVGADDNAFDTFDEAVAAVRELALDPEWQGLEWAVRPVGSGIGIDLIPVDPKGTE